MMATYQFPIPPQWGFAIDPNAVASALAAAGVVVDDGVSVRSDGAITFDSAIDPTAAVAALNWSALTTASTVDPVATMKSLLANALTGTTAQKTAALAAIKAWKDS